MTKKIILILFLPLISFSQNIDKLFHERGEINFSFKYNNKIQLNKISDIISIDHKTNSHTAYAYANKKEFKDFLELDIDYDIIKHKPSKLIQSSKSNWNYYPTYDEYVDLMMAFTDSFPSLCKTYSLGTLNSGREILCVQISDNVGQKEDEPSFLYTSSMHGDELAGYILSLRLIDYLLNQYGTNQEITNLVNEIDIWINPLANPDGAYYGGNQDVWSATRYNANFIDLNRNYPDPQDGPHPDGNPYQQETNIFLGLADSINFTISANMHGGVEVCNYPWDTWSTLTADDNWWQYVAQQYADSCQLNSSNGYFNYLNDGITNGNEWYEVDGGRQDYMNYFRYCREITLELSDDKTPNPNDLNDLWDANFPSLLNYMEQSLNGLRGIITDSISGLPIKARIEILGHDIDSSHVYSNLPIGNYHRLLIQGNYDVTFSKNGYHSKIVNATVLNNQAISIDVELVPININPNSVNEEIYTPINKKKFDLLGRDISLKNKKTIKRQKIGTRGDIVID
ncbi:M14 family zinc carboxypeptidase [Flavobacteriales bacterium]|nr:M14 family zinc carboxypeptidase [Flavobacteriales bacterium]